MKYFDEGGNVAIKQHGYEEAEDISEGGSMANGFTGV